MATSTVVDINTQLISSTNIGFIRPIQVQVKCINIRPNTRLYAWFDNTEVTRFITQTNGTGSHVKGDPIVSDEFGEVEAVFDIPGMTFSTGIKKFTLNEIPSRAAGGGEVGIIDDGLSVNSASQIAPPNNTDPEVSYTVAIGQITGSATAEFVSTGIKKIFQTTQTTTNTTTIEQVVTVENHIPWSPAPPRGDPLAETFFTTGIKDGIFITSIELYFKDKDPSAPIWVEIRETQTGFPVNTLVAPWATATVRAADVNISDDASASTKFVFPKMVFLKPDSDYCFVIQTRSNKYNAWTSKMGEVSKETGRIVFDQPYNGSLLKSENNYTWTAEQTEDVKFKLNRAKFNTGVGTVLEFPLVANAMYVATSSFYTVSGTNIVYGNFTFKHGLDQNSKIAINCDPSGKYNGVAGTLMAGSHVVSSVLSEYIIAFNVIGATFTSSSVISTGERVTDIQVETGGSGYSEITPPVLQISAPSSGVTATATAIVKNGKIDHVVLTNQGSGYTSAPTVTIVAGTPGTGATFTALTNDIFTVSTNRVYHEINPAISSFTPSNTILGAELSTTLGSFEDGNVTMYATGKNYNIELGKYNKFDNNLALVSRTNEIERMGSAHANVMTLTMNTTNDTVSPIIDIPASRIYYSSNRINNQFSSSRPMESVTSTNTSGSLVTGIFTTALGAAGQITSGGTGHTGATQTLTFLGTGYGAAGTATITGGAVTSITITVGGYGYNVPPKIVFPSGTGTAVCFINNYNSELYPTGGNALARYFTKRQQLATVSTSANVFVNAYSNADSSFEVYIRTSLAASGSDHSAQPWKLLTCDITRNKSPGPGKFTEYKFYASSIPSFDLYSFKIVLRTNTPWDPPIIRDYRAIILA